MIYDIFTYDGEADIFDLRYNILKDHVDGFIVVEFPTTFSGKPKPIYFKEIEDKYPKAGLLTANFGEVWKLLSRSIRSPLTDGLEAYSRAYYQKDYARWIVDIKDEDIVYFGDVDEIWTPQEVDDKGYKLEQIIYTNYLNLRSDESWTGTVVTRGKNLKDHGFNELRKHIKLTKPNGGWHFTFQGGEERILKKLNDYDHQEMNTPEWRDKVAENLKNNKPPLSTKHNLWIDEESWPQYLKDNKDKYKHLLRP